MTTERIMLKPGVWLQYVQTDRFKTGCFSFNLLRPLARSDAAPNALLPTVLLRGCSGYPDMQAISRRLDTLYGASTGTLVRKKGEVQSVGLYADFLEDRYAGGAPLFSDMLDLVGRLLFEPVTVNGGFAKAFVDSERQNLEDTIAARINEKRSYAIHRLLQHMCRGEAYAVPRLVRGRHPDGGQRAEPAGPMAAAAGRGPGGALLPGAAAQRRGAGTAPGSDGPAAGRGEGFRSRHPGPAARPPGGDRGGGHGRDPGQADSGDCAPISRFETPGIRR